MQVQFKFPRKLQGIPDKDGKPSAKLFSAGSQIHEVPDEMAENWFFKAMVKAGDISVIPVAIAASKADKPTKAAPSQPQKKA